MFPVSQIASAVILRKTETTDQKFLEKIDQFLLKGDLANALEYILMLLGDGNYPEHSLIYGYISRILKEGDRDLFLKIVGNLMPANKDLMHTTFLSRSSSCLEEQRRLALEIGDAQLIYNEHSLEFTHLWQAMEYYSCGRQMASTREQICEVDRKASLLLLKAGLDGKNFEKQLDSTRGNLDLFNQLLSRLEKIGETFCRSNDELESIKTSYERIGKHLNAIPVDKKALYQTYMPKIRSGITSPSYSTKGSYPVERYRQLLEEVRKAFAPLPTNYIDMRQFQSAIREKFKDFFCALLEDLRLLLGPPPCHYEIRGLGSFANEEMGPFSDIELMILLENNETATLNYINLLINCFDLQLRIFGEKKTIPLVFPNVTFHNGIEIDGDPLRCPGFMGTPEHLASSHQLSLLPNSDVCRTAEHTILTSSELFGTGTLLFDKYKEDLASIWEIEEEGVAVWKRRVCSYLKCRLDAFVILKREKQQDILKLKIKYIEPLYCLLSDFSIFWNIRTSNTLDVVEQLAGEERGVFTARSKKILTEAVTTLYRLKIEQHLIHGRQEEVSIQSVSARDRNFLERIQWLVLCPLYHALEGAFPQDLSKLSQQDLVQFEQKFKQLDLVEIAFQQALDATDPSLFVPVIEQLVLLLLDEGVQEAIFIEYFTSLSKGSSQREVLRQAFFEIIEKKAPGPLLDVLLEIPNQGGVRLSYRKRYSTLYQQIANISERHPQTVGRVSVRMICANSELRYLKSEVVSDIIDPSSGNIKKKEDENNAHAVFATGGLYFKQKPFQPLMEFAIHDLFYRLWGYRTPPSELVRFEVEFEGKQIVYPVLISQEVEGVTLKKAVSLPSLEAPEVRSSLTQLLIGSILTRPGDGRLSNYVIDREGRFFSVDNDISFVEPIFRSWFGSKKVNFSSALFCLYENFILDEKICREFIDLDVDRILEDWLDGLIIREKKYERLFSDEEQSRFYNEDEKNRFTRKILFRAGTLAVVKLQFWQLKGFFQTMIEQGKAITSFDLLNQLISLNDSDVANTVGSFVSKAYRNKEKIPEERLKKATSRTADKSTTSSKYLEEQFGRIPSYEEVAKKQPFSPEKAKEELLSSGLDYHTETVQIRTSKGKRSIHANFRVLVGLGDPDGTRQLAVLKTLELQVQTMTEKPTIVTLCYCPVLDSKKLVPFLDENIEYLDISYCPQISLSVIQQIQKKCPRLKELNVSGCAKLTNIEEGFFENSYIHFPNLEFLLISECINLSSLKIKADGLKKIECKKNKNLVELRLDTKNFPRIIMEGSDGAHIEFFNLKETCVTSADFALAKEFYLARLESTSLVRSLDKEQDGVLLNNAGWVHFNLNLLDESKGFYEKALLVYRTLKDQDGILTVLKNLIVLLEKWPDNSQADNIEAYRKEYEEIRIARYGRDPNQSVMM